MLNYTGFLLDVSIKGLCGGQASNSLVVFLGKALNGIRQLVMQGAG